MINPDGVIAGNSRSSLYGEDLNRTFLKPSMRINPESFAIK